MLKSVDPTLGIYAATAYADAGLYELVASVEQSVRNNLGVNLLDIALLKRNGLQGRSLRTEAVPCCPMLSQNWALLRAQRVNLGEKIAELQNNLAVSLWLTLDPQAMAQMHGLLANGSWR